MTDQTTIHLGEPPDDLKDYVREIEEGSTVGPNLYSEPLATPELDEFLLPVWRVQQVLRDYADAIEQGSVPHRSGPEALRQSALMMANVA
jgi:hypothetical protein